ncbi:MAG: hypothetical protein E4G94_11285 [ANME-2 cluster archaeon]|nr:MAG: hypothetical protein E4G94_11285 [ANME-2 cluster archaeon]
MTNALSTILFENIGIIQSFLVTSLLIIIVIAIIALLEWLKEKRRKNLIPDPKLCQLNKKYPGLIVLLSLPNKKFPEEEKSRNKAINEYYDEWKNRIDKAYDNFEALQELFEVIGIGQTFKAIYCHSGKLRNCWLIYSNESHPNVRVVKYFTKKNTKKTVSVYPIEIKNPNNIQSIKPEIMSIYRNAEKYYLNQEDIISDFTGGTKVMSAAVVVSCIPQNRHIEYVEQSTNEIIEVEIHAEDLINQ